MRVAHVLTAPRAEGTPRLVLDWLDVAIDQHVFFLTDRPDTLLSFFRAKAPATVNNRILRRYVKFFTIAREVYKFCKKTNPDLVIAWPTGVSQYIHIGARLAGVKRHLTHAGNPPSRHGLFARYIYSYLSFWPSYLLGARVICCSDYVRREYSKIPGVPKAIFYSVYNNFHPERFLTAVAKRSIKQAAMVATLENHKDHKTLLEAWREVIKNEDQVSLILAGDGSLKNYLIGLSRSLQLERIQFMGYVADVPELLKQCGVFVFSTTKDEGFGTVLLEALAAGLKVVASDVPACREVLQDGKYGILVPPKDPEALANAIVKGFEEPLTQGQVAAQIEYASQFTPENMMRHYLKIAGFEEEAKKLVNDTMSVR